ncbi:U3 small nucleolar RNA-associated protein 12 [Astathelohania contejeani]|uniref:U3 small nucleolar RNA-associated protein 12 n=1 Tax=Astathelohania contejeani TaxID=164912 RepID=A0ABQ7HWG9_9MICR|nr:U3 small nucleolar RNA-associated protein 12 [Thelohania contejeani]
MEGPFIPDFTLQHSQGEFFTENSIIFYQDNITYITQYNKVVLCDITQYKILGTIGSSKNIKITAFNLFLTDEKEIFYVLGYENGIIKIYDKFNNAKNQFKAFSREVTRIRQDGDTIFASSMDGVLISYSWLEEGIKNKLEGPPIADFAFGEGRIFCGCTDQTIRTWEMETWSNTDICFPESIPRRLEYEKNILFIQTSKNELIFKSYDSLMDTLSELIKFNSYKRFSDFKISNNLLFVLARGKLYFYKIKEASTKLVDLGVLKIDKAITKFFVMNKPILGDEETEFFEKKFVVMPEFVCGGSNNTLLHYKNGMFLNHPFHNTAISQIEYNGSDIIITLSEEKIIFWKIIEDRIEKTGEISGSYNIMCCMDFYLVLGNSDGIYVYSMDTFDLQFKEDVGSIKALHYKNSILVAGLNNTLKFYKNDLTHKRDFNCEEAITYLRISNNGSFIAVAMLNNKINLYDMHTMDIRTSLYGHSLPVRYFDFSVDDKILISCGADKLVKIWGTEYGECRKTLIGDANNMEFIGDDLFLFGCGDICYYHKFECIRKFKDNSSSLIRKIKSAEQKLNGFISCGKYNLNYYKINQYEFMDEEEESIEEEEIDVVNQRACEDFMESIEYLEKGITKHAVSLLYSSILRLDLSELNKYLYLLDNKSIYLLGEGIKFLVENEEWNVVIIGRLFCGLARFNRCMIEGSEVYKRIYFRIMERMECLKEVLCENYYLK